MNKHLVAKHELSLDRKEAEHSGYRLIDTALRKRFPNLGLLYKAIQNRAIKLADI